MRNNFNISKSTIIFSLYVIISASFMQQILDLIQYNLWIPKKVNKVFFEKKMIDKLDKEDDKKALNIFYSSTDNNGNKIINNNLSKDDKVKLKKILLKTGKIDVVPIFIWIIFGIFGILLTAYLLKNDISFLRIFFFFIIFDLGVLYALTINKFVSERIHLIYYCIIGILFAKDNFQGKKVLSVIYSLIFACLVATIDEIFQFFLPYRVGDIRDVIFDTLGGLWGGLIYIIINAKDEESDLHFWKNLK